MSTYIVVAEYKAAKRGKPSTYMVSEHDTLEAARTALVAEWEQLADHSEELALVAEWEQLELVAEWEQFGPPPLPYW